MALRVVYVGDLLALVSFASSEGTLRFRQRHEGSSVARGHFREFNGLHFSSLGVGTYLGEPDAATDELVTNAVVESIKSGAVNVVDTAINYRFQKAERSVGRALKRLFEEKVVSRDEVFVSTKNGYLAPDADSELDQEGYLAETLVKPGILDPKDVVQGMHCMSPRFLEDQLGRSLANLGLDAVDLIYLHNAAESQLGAVGRPEFMARLSSAFEFYEKERRRGRVRFYGLATWGCFRVPPQRPEYLNLEDVVGLAEDVGGESHGFRFIQLPHSMAMPEGLVMRNQWVGGDDVTIFQAAVRLKIGVFTSAPLLEGRLVASSVLRPVAPLDSKALTCLQFARSTEGVLAPLVGHKSPEHVEENLRIAGFAPLTAGEFGKVFMAVA
ncbi:MAG: aldo/keto reductase [Thaumarchaeota archaeon]|nr:aldo/keto reductase [Nitrososphaerota archaeon]